jgi:hypothetical protein
LGVCVFVASLFCFWMARWWTLETAASLFSPSLHLETMWMRLFHDGKGVSRFETKESIHFGDFWHIHDDFAKKMLQTSYSKAEKAPSY